MKNLLMLTLLILLTLLYSCGDDTVNNLTPTPDFDIYLVKRDFQNNLVSTYTIKSDGTDHKLFNDSLSVIGNSYRDKILLTSSSYLYSNIYIANYNGSNMTNISLSNFQISGCNLSPDAAKLYFSVETSGSGLYIINSDATGLVQITDQLVVYNSVKFSPNGKMIAYLEPSYYPNHRGTKLFISNTSGTYKRLLKDSIQDGGFVDWSNDGKKIVYHYLVLGINAAVKIGVIDTANSNFAVLTQGYYPAYSPAGNKICFVNTVNNRADLFLMDPDGTNIVNITNTANTSEYKIKWSKEGMRILYATNEGSNYEKLWMYDLNTNSSTFLADSVFDAIWQ